MKIVQNFFNAKTSGYVLKFNQLDVPLFPLFIYYSILFNINQKIKESMPHFFYMLYYLTYYLTKGGLPKAAIPSNAFPPAYRSSLKYGSPRLAGGWFSFLFLMLVITSTINVTTYGIILNNDWVLRVSPGI